MKKTITITAKFDVGDIVTVQKVQCKILEVDFTDGQPDYLCQPLDEKIIVLGQTELGAGWVLQRSIDGEVFI